MAEVSLFGANRTGCCHALSEDLVEQAQYLRVKVSEGRDEGTYGINL